MIMYLIYYLASLPPLQEALWHTRDYKKVYLKYKNAIYLCKIFLKSKSAGELNDIKCFTLTLHFTIMHS